MSPCKNVNSATAAGVKNAHQLAFSTGLKIEWIHLKEAEIRKTSGEYRCPDFRGAQIEFERWFATVRYEVRSSPSQNPTGKGSGMGAAVDDGHAVHNHVGNARRIRRGIGKRCALGDRYGIESAMAPRRRTPRSAPS